MKRFVIDPTSDLSQDHSFAIAMATLIHNGFDLCKPISMQQESDGIGNIVFTQDEDMPPWAKTVAIVILGAVLYAWALVMKVTGSV